MPPPVLRVVTGDRGVRSSGVHTPLNLLRSSPARVKISNVGCRNPALRHTSTIRSTPLAVAEIANWSTLAGFTDWVKGMCS